ncbi:MAG: hypothetical protein U0794_06980, partial [Isosphaeraceae bacterium]
MDVISAGTVLRAQWNKAFQLLSESADTNRDGSVDEAEAARLPSPYALRQGPPHVIPGYPPNWGDLDRDSDGKASPSEIANAYRRHGLGRVLVGTGRPLSAPKLTEAILGHLDPDRDGSIRPNEVLRVVRSLLALDSNGDELVTPGELVSALPYPGTTAPDDIVSTQQFDPSNPSQNRVDSDRPIVVLPCDPREQGWADWLLACRDGNTDSVLTQGEAGLAGPTFE